MGTAVPALMLQARTALPSLASVTYHQGRGHILPLLAKATSLALAGGTCLDLGAYAAGGERGGTEQVSSGSHSQGVLARSLQ